MLFLDADAPMVQRLDFNVPNTKSSRDMAFAMAFVALRGLYWLMAARWFGFELEETKRSES
jgi:hypothetical protein